MQVHLQLMLVCGGRQLQLIRVENRLECRSGPFQTQVTTVTVTVTARMRPRNLPLRKSFRVKVCALQSPQWM